MQAELATQRTCARRAHLALVRLVHVHAKLLAHLVRQRSLIALLQAAARRSRERQQQAPAPARQQHRPPSLTRRPISRAIIMRSLYSCGCVLGSQRGELQPLARAALPRHRRAITFFTDVSLNALSKLAMTTMLHRAAPSGRFCCQELPLCSAAGGERCPRRTARCCWGRKGDTQHACHNKSTAQELLCQVGSRLLWCVAPSVTGRRLTSCRRRTGVHAAHVPAACPARMWDGRADGRQPPPPRRCCIARWPVARPRAPACCCAPGRMPAPRLAPGCRLSCPAAPSAPAAPPTQT